MARQYVYKVTSVEKVIDGDTYWLHLDVGFRQSQLAHLRLLGYDTPECYSGSLREMIAATAAANVATGFLADPAFTYWVRTLPDPDSFGRWLADVWREDATSIEHLGVHLRAQGLASVWPTRWREEFDT